ncbi:putative bifunctional diguanylate cyclase/phosphodiesterase [Geodermatophilus normandii]|uniref:EAL domain-containing protein n=1 Tax=Geodermatophilus normandii TaxID=1137989 RepID=A0A6P0GDX1_9ACTN|nr:GGDEF domain-containing phosphodiesterase [Geodermatophilus normandii]NEM04549.1 EAL domain-containing protein [Geodermatophilus normandii]
MSATAEDGTAEDGTSRRALRGPVVRDALVVLVLTCALAAASGAVDLPARVAAWSAATGLPLDQAVLVLAGAHVPMMWFGARRGQQLRDEGDARAEAEARLREDARRDRLTGVASHPAFVAAVGAAHADGTVPPGPAVVLLDVDRFGEVNATLGHEVGDGLLVALAQRLSGLVPAGALLARTGADAFGVLLTGPDAAEAGPLAERIARATRRPLRVGDLCLAVDVSVGVAELPGRDAQDTLNRAEVARTAAESSSGGLCRYSPAIDTFDPGRLALHDDLRRAVRERTLAVHYQPKARLGDGRVTGVEALVRWDHPEHGLLLPGRFLPLAEQTSLVRPLTEVVLERALTDCRRWRDSGLALSVAVNLSPRLLQDADLPGRVAGLLSATGVDPADLELEITETAVLEDADRASLVLAHLRALGVRLSVDDFGTGHASLTHLARLPVTDLKVDRSFVTAMGDNPVDAAIVRSIVELAGSLGLGVVAEGVEDEAAWEGLRAMGCRLAQGFWIARPVPADDVPGVVRDVEHRIRQRTAAAGPRSLVG